MSSEDLIVWPNNVMCFREYLEQMGGMSDDYRVVKSGTDEWYSLMEDDPDWDHEEQSLYCGCCAGCGCCCSTEEE